MKSLTIVGRIMAGLLVDVVSCPDPAIVVVMAVAVVAEDIRACWP